MLLLLLLVLLLLLCVGWPWNKPGGNPARPKSGCGAFDEDDDDDEEDDAGRGDDARVGPVMKNNYIR